MTWFSSQLDFEATPRVSIAWGETLSMFRTKKGGTSRGGGMAQAAGFLGSDGKPARK